MNSSLTPRIVAIGSDHAGFELKQHLIAVLSKAGHTVIDHGTDSTESVDYPPFCAAVPENDVTARLVMVMP